MSQKIGFLAEKKARHFLKRQGLQWVASNYRCRCGEIDLIMRDDECLIFVEVRARVSNAFGNAAATVTYRKRQKLIKAASLYLLANPLQGDQAIRFDIVGLDGMPPRVSWIKNAFGSDF